MKSVKVLFTLLALGFGLTGYSQSVTIINDTGCDFDLLFNEGYYGSGCVSAATLPNITVAAGTTSSVTPSLDELVYVEITNTSSTSNCSIGVALVPDVALNCQRCSASPGVPSSDTDYCSTCGKIKMTWTVDCQTGAGTLTIEKL